MYWRLTFAVCLVGGLVASADANETNLRRAPVLVESGYIGGGYGASIQHGVVQHGAVQHGAVQHGAVQHGAVQHGIVQHGIVQHGGMAGSFFSGATGCCGSQPGCCDKVWEGYCGMRRLGCDPVCSPRLPIHGGHFLGKGCGKGCGKSCGKGCGKGYGKGCGKSCGWGCGFGFGMVAPSACAPCGSCGKSCGGKCGHRSHRHNGHGLFSTLKTSHGLHGGCGCKSHGWSRTYGKGAGYGYAKGHAHLQGGCSSCGDTVIGSDPVPSMEYSAPVLDYSAPKIDAPTVAPPVQTHGSATGTDQHSADRPFRYGSLR